MRSPSRGKWGAFGAALGLALFATPASAASDCTTIGGETVSEKPGAMPGFCRITGVLRPVAGSKIGYELWLPVPERWTGRFQMVGNGGYASAIPTDAMAAALRRGSAVVATDTGHKGDDPDFAIGRPESIVDWGWRAVHLTAAAAKSTVARYYGRPASHSYFNGCSTGGHQAMMEAQRFPADFDGIVAGAPGSNRVRLNAAFLWQFRANHRADGSTILDAQDLGLLAGHALKSCPARIAQGDDWLADPVRCRPSPEALLCRPGQGANCLSSEKVAAARAMYEGARDPKTGERLTFPWLPGSEGGWDRYWADPRRPDQPARANFWRIWAFRNPSWDWRRFDFARDLPLAQQRLSPVIDATDPDLSAFRARGGKLLQYHGLDDPVVSPLDTLEYRARVMERLRASPQHLARWFRLFLIPGMGHCGGGPGFTQFDAQSAIERWVERGDAPGALVATSARRPGKTRNIAQVQTGRETR